MGCDIHLYVEKRLNDGRWGCVDYFKTNPFYSDDPLNEKEYEHISIYNSRDYALFATLANVRNYGDITPISEPRGLPDDVSDIVEKASNDWGDNGHSHSWFTAKELFIHKNKCPFTKHSGLISPEAQEKLDKYGIVPAMWCQGTNEVGWERREWIIPNSVLDRLIEAVKKRMCEEFWIWDFLKPEEKEEKLWDNADDFRIIFWFDN